MCVWKACRLQITGIDPQPLRLTEASTMCLCVLPAPGVVAVWGFLGAAAPLVLPPEAPELGAPVFPPLEGQCGAVRHQATLFRSPTSLPFLCADEEECPVYMEGRAATAEVTVGNPEGLGAPPEMGVGARPEDGLY
ncbi:hypothetical protein GOODEAATRI_000971 [Goodea atripinnis]|uniref:Uncharacterized protein n=1 Tax=Goodea atripinnis TaxID=208336 RepID=A0ABV0MQ72_9TELE